jgi:O-antigen ligase
MTYFEGKSVGIKDWIFLFTWMILFFVLPVFPDLVPPFILLNFLVHFIFFKYLRFNGGVIRILWPMILLYAFYALGMNWTEHSDLGFTSLERKMSLLAFPILFLITGKKDERFFRFAFFLLILGLLLNMVLSFGQAFVCWYSGGNRDCFFSSNLSYNIHPSYLSMYAVLGIAFLVYDLVKYRSTVGKKQLWVYSSGIMLLSVFVVFLSSKAGLLSLGLCFLLAGIWTAIQLGKIKLILKIVGTAFVGITLFLLFSSVPLERFKNAIAVNALSEEELFDQHKTSIESNVVRRMIWIVSLELIAEHPNGVGTGDVIPVLLEKYKMRGMTGALEKEFNCHNQYLQTTIALGWMGGILVVIMILWPLTLSIRRKDPLLLFFFLLFGINILVESMLEVQAGVVFFSLFAGVFAIRTNT